MFALNVAQAVLDIDTTAAIDGLPAVDLVSPFVFPLSSILMSRFILDLREINGPATNETSFRSDLEFARNVGHQPSAGEGNVV